MPPVFNVAPCRTWLRGSVQLVSLTIEGVVRLKKTGMRHGDFAAGVVRSVATLKRGRWLGSVHGGAVVRAAYFWNSRYFLP